MIARNDEGRVSEYVQAEARKILVEQDINYYERINDNVKYVIKIYGFPRW